MTTQNQARLIGIISGLLVASSVFSVTVFCTKLQSLPSYSSTLRFTHTNLLNHTTMLIIPVTPAEWRALTNRYPGNVVAGEVKFN